MPRLAYIFTDLPTQEGTFAVAELQAMREHGFEIEIFCLRSNLSSGPGAEAIRGKFRVHRAPYVGVRPLAAFLRAWLRQPWRLTREIAATIGRTAENPSILLKTLAILPKTCLFAEEARAARVDLSVSYWASLPGQAARWMSLVGRVPYATWAHAGADIYNRAHQTEPALKAILADASLVLTCNQANVAYFDTILSAAERSKVAHHPHGVDVSRFGPRPDSAAPSRGDAARTLRLLSVGRLSEAKGFDHAVRAVGLVRDRGIDVRYRIIGEGKERAALESLVAELALGDRVELPGALEQEKLPIEYHAADVFLMPSVIGRRGGRDGLPNVLLEAMACELASIGSDAVGIPEAIVSGQNGLLAPPADPVGLADAIASLAGDPDERRRLGANARKLVLEKYARTPAMERLALLLGAACRNASRAPATG